MSTSVPVIVDHQNADPVAQVEQVYMKAAQVGLPLEFVSATVLMENIPGIGKARVLEIREKVRAMGVVPDGSPTAPQAPKDDPGERMVRAAEAIANNLGAVVQEIRRQSDRVIAPMPEEPLQGEVLQGEGPRMGAFGPVLVLVGSAVAGLGYTGWLPSVADGYAGVAVAVLGVVLITRGVFRRRNSKTAWRSEEPEAEMAMR